MARGWKKLEFLAQILMFVGILALVWDGTDWGFHVIVKRE